MLRWSPPVTNLAGRVWCGIGNLGSTPPWSMQRGFTPMPTTWMVSGTLVMSCYTLLHSQLSNMRWHLANCMTHGEAHQRALLVTCIVCAAVQPCLLPVGTAATLPSQYLQTYNKMFVCYRVLCVQVEEVVQYHACSWSDSR